MVGASELNKQYVTNSRLFPSTQVPKSPLFQDIASLSTSYEIFLDLTSRAAFTPPLFLVRTTGQTSHDVPLLIDQIICQ